MDARDDFAIQVDPVHADQVPLFSARGKARVVNEEEEYVSLMYNATRNCFIRRVYGTLSLQLMATAAICCLCMFVAPLRTFCLNFSGVIVWTTLIPVFLVIFALYRFKSSYPANYTLLGVFTVLESLVLGSVCAIYYANGAGIVLAQAVVLTASVFVALTVYAFMTKRDFSFLGAGLFTCLWVLIGWSLLSAIIGFQTGVIFSLFGALLFCGFILFDTSKIINNYSYDDHIVASIDLYLDILNLFLFVLQLLSRRD
eukprot:TRINITY_DN33038_c0_g1_i1.p1 TRINITY_DN33038_c0_g1~~TRINITY_DN33038_c0_g1_i1.p1  ORF type:complete len:269 (+),score=65.14 TRINITY_DN33038_c0_g1_i1:41-808(+)